MCARRSVSHVGKCVVSRLDVSRRYHEETASRVSSVNTDNARCTGMRCSEWGPRVGDTGRESFAFHSLELRSHSTLFISVYASANS